MFFRQVWTIAAKDLHSELRTKEAWNASIAFSVVILLLFAFAFDPSSDQIREFGSGLLVALGLFGPVGPALMLSVMIVAAVSVHLKNGVFAMSNGIEIALLYGAAAAALALTGPGRYSLDAVFGLTSAWTPALTWTVLGLGIAGGAANLAIRRPAPAPAAA